MKKWFYKFIDLELPATVVVPAIAIALILCIVATL